MHRRIAVPIKREFVQKLFCHIEISGEQNAHRRMLIVVCFANSSV